MNNTPTPRTDEAQFGTGRVSVDFARRLERELAAVTEQRDEAREDIAKLREIAESAINYLDQSYRDGFSDEANELRYELNNLRRK